MNPAVAFSVRSETAIANKTAGDNPKTPERPTVLIATADPEIREGLAQLLEAVRINAIWVSGVKDVKTLVARERIVACLCGFWLQDGTYREVIRHLRRERKDIPAIIVSTPSCPHEYGEYLAAMDLGALDFLCHPYQSVELERMLQSALASKERTARAQTPGTEIDFRQRGAA